jgi:2,4-dienoyl-CoA reductase (NADPH2)
VCAPIKRTDDWGGSIDNRMRLASGDRAPGARRAVGPNFILMYRHSVLDLVEGGNSWAEVVDVARALEAAGVTLFNTGIGWHEARTPTIVTSVPRAAFASVAARLKKAVKVPVIASNRINMPDDAEASDCQWHVDMVSMARPFLADPEWVNKVAAGAGRRNQYLHCLQPGLPGPHLCQQACQLPGQPARRARDRAGVPQDRTATKKVAVVGAGPAGLSAATVAAECGHDVTLFDSSDRIGGQFNVAMQVPGKEEFAQTLRYFAKRIEITGVKVKLNKRVTRAVVCSSKALTTWLWPPALCRACHVYRAWSTPRWCPTWMSCSAK